MKVLPNAVIKNGKLYFDEYEFIFNPHGMTDINIKNDAGNIIVSFSMYQKICNYDDLNDIKE